MGFMLRGARGVRLELLELLVHVNKVLRRSAMSGDMPSTATLVASGLWVIGFDPPLTRPTSTLKRSS